jgi:hypothetical protein
MQSCILTSLYPCILALVFSTLYSCPYILILVFLSLYSHPCILVLIFSSLYSCLRVFSPLYSYTLLFSPLYSCLCILVLSNSCILVLSNSCILVLSSSCHVFSCFHILSGKSTIIREHKSKRIWGQQYKTAWAISVTIGIICISF